MGLLDRLRSILRGKPALSAAEHGSQGEQVPEQQEAAAKREPKPGLPRIGPEVLPSEFDPFDDDSGPGGDLFKQAISAWNGGDPDRAATFYAEALERGLTPKYSNAALANLGEIHLGRGDLEQGVDYLLRSLATRPLTAGKAHDAAVRLQIIYEEASRRDEAAALAAVAGATARPDVVLAYSYAEELRELVRKAQP